MAILNAVQSDVGIFGLEITGRKAALHLAERHFNVAAFDWGRELTAGPRVRMAANVSELMASLRQPRTILIFSRADAPMNSVLDQLLPDLTHGDLLMDAGDSHFKDTATHSRRLAGTNIPFIGLGLAGGENGAPHGAIVMAGGGGEARNRARPLLEAIATTVRGEPCMSCFDTPAAAHFVKMVHAGVEYALLQLLSETFDLLQHSLLLTDEELHDRSGAWHSDVLNGYLMEISGRVFQPVNQQTPRLLLEEKLESAKNDPLGRWVTQSARELGVRVPTIEAAAGIQRVTEAERRRALLAAPFRHPAGRFADDSKSVLNELHGALHAAIMIAYAQGMDLLIAASKELGFQFKLHEISRAWRGCAHLRTTLLDDITNALEATPDLPGLLSDDDLSEAVMACQENLRHAVWRARHLDIAAPALLASLDYLDSNRAAWLPVNLIQTPRPQPAAPALQTKIGH